MLWSFSQCLQINILQLTQVAINKFLKGCCIINLLVWKHFITISIFGLSYKLVCGQNFAFLNRYQDTLCEGRNSIKYITIPPLEIYLFATSLNVTYWSNFWTSPMELLLDFILDKMNDKKKTYIKYRILVIYLYSPERNGCRELSKL